MRMQSPKTGIKSGETWDMEGCALANKTWQSIGEGPGRGLRKYLIGAFDWPGDAEEYRSKIKRREKTNGSYTKSLDNESSKM